MQRDGVFSITNSLCSVMKTVCLEGYLKGASLLVLIDSDATHYFITLNPM